jgi:hypothetical protein
LKGNPGRRGKEQRIEELLAKLPVTCPELAVPIGPERQVVDEYWLGVRMGDEVEARMPEHAIGIGGVVAEHRRRDHFEPDEPIPGD